MRIIYYIESTSAQDDFVSRLNFVRNQYLLETNVTY